MGFEEQTPHGHEVDEESRRIVAATLRVIARHGLTRLSLDDVAGEAGMSRATLYRRYPGKAALVEAVVNAETARLRQGLDAALADVTTLDEALAAAAGFGARELAGHAALQFLLAHEPGSVLPHLCFGGGDRLLDVLAGCVGPHLCRFLPPLQARRAGEWLGRIVLSYGLTPDGRTSPDGEEPAVGVVRQFVAPAFDSEDRRD